MKTRKINNMETDLFPPANKRKQGPASHGKPVKTNQGRTRPPTVGQNTNQYHMMDDPLFNDPAWRDVAPYNRFHVVGINDY